jgi:hypothetical protein
MIIRCLLILITRASLNDGVFLQNYFSGLSAYCVKQHDKAEQVVRDWPALDILLSSWPYPESTKSTSCRMFGPRVHSAAWIA